MPHFRETCYEFFSAKVTFSAGAYFDSVWSTLIIDRSSRPDVFCEKGVLRIFAKFTGKHLCQSLFLNKIAGLRLWHRCRCFPMNFAKFLRTPFLTEYLWWLLGNVACHYWIKNIMQMLFSYFQPYWSGNGWSWCSYHTLR